MALAAMMFGGLGLYFCWVFGFFASFTFLLFTVGP